jgi:hypothetical protein
VNRVSCQVTDKVREVTRKVGTDFVIVLAYWVVGIQTTRDFSWDTTIRMRFLREIAACSGQPRDTEYQIKEKNEERKTQI